MERNPELPHSRSQLVDPKLPVIHGKAPRAESHRRPQPPPRPES